MSGLIFTLVLKHWLFTDDFIE